MTNEIVTEVETVLQEVEAFFENLFKKVDAEFHPALTETKQSIITALTPTVESAPESAPEPVPESAPESAPGTDA